jgi:hypothetical protein
VTGRAKRLNDMRWCANCHHGHAAHRNGFGPCFGEHMRQGAWFSCQCQGFTHPEEEDPPQDPQ